MTNPLVTVALLIAVVGACDRAGDGGVPLDRPTADAAAVEGITGPDAAPPATPDRPETGPSCEERRALAKARLSVSLEAHGRCRWDVDCVVIDPSSECVTVGPVAVASAAVVQVRTVIDELRRELCPGGADDECRADGVASPGGVVTSCEAGRCRVVLEAADRASRPVLEPPPQNAASLTEPPPRPPVGDAEERARRLFEAIVHDDPDRAMDFFFPGEAFEIVKGIVNPMEYYRRLLARYLQDIHDLHGSTADLDRAEFLRLDLNRRGGWVGVREEGNRLPYWASRHSAIVYRVNGEERRLEVRVLITWGERWYVIHLSEFR